MSKKKFIIVSAVIIIILAVSSYGIYRNFSSPSIPGFDEQIRSDVTTLKVVMPKDKESCVAKGGVWKRLGPRPFEECNLPTRDGGKPCTGSSECEGVCLSELTREQLSAGMRGKKFRTGGKCSDFHIVMGCRGYVYRGWASVVCAD